MPLDMDHHAFFLQQSSIKGTLPAESSKLPKGMNEEYVHNLARAVPADDGILGSYYRVDDVYITSKAVIERHGTNCNDNGMFAIKFEDLENESLKNAQVWANFMDTCSIYTLLNLYVHMCACLVNRLHYSTRHIYLAADPGVGCSSNARKVEPLVSACCFPAANKQRATFSTPQESN
jgi:hypothetical protein